MGSSVDTAFGRCIVVGLVLVPSAFGELVIAVAVLFPLILVVVASPGVFLKNGCVHCIGPLAVLVVLWSAVVEVGILSHCVYPGYSSVELEYCLFWFPLFLFLFYA